MTCKGYSRTRVLTETNRRPMTRDSGTLQEGLFSKNIRTPEPDKTWLNCPTNQLSP